jgi:hypothetical protein
VNHIVKSVRIRRWNHYDIKRLTGLQLVKLSRKKLALIDRFGATVIVVNYGEWLVQESNGHLYALSNRDLKNRFHKVL